MGFNVPFLRKIKAVLDRTVAYTATMSKAKEIAEKANYDYATALEIILEAETRMAKTLKESRDEIANSKN
jgi:uncharacterized protein with HEPN domain